MTGIVTSISLAIEAKVRIIAHIHDVLGRSFENDQRSEGDENRSLRTWVLYEALQLTWNFQHA